MKKSLLFISLILSLIWAKAQEPKFEWAKNMGVNGPSTNEGNCIAVDVLGNIYTIGEFSGTGNFGSKSISSNGETDIFISKTDAIGNSVWTKTIGGIYGDKGNSIAIDAAGNVYCTGSASGTDFDPGIGTFYIQGYGAFILKLDASGNFVWAKNMVAESLSGSEGSSLKLDRYGNVYTTGEFTGVVDFNPGSGKFNLSSFSAWESDVFISKLDASGNFIWAKQMGGTSNEKGVSLAVDELGNVITTGYFFEKGDFDPGEEAFNLTSAGYDDIFISKLDASGNFVWAKNIGGTISDNGRSITVDKSGNIYLTGEFTATVDFDPGNATYHLTATPTNNYNIFISKFDGSGSFVWAKRLGGTSISSGRSIAVDGSGNVFTSGFFYETADFDPGPGKFDINNAGKGDVFISKLDAYGNFAWAKNFGGTKDDMGLSIALDGPGNIYTTGYFWGTVDFNSDTTENFSLNCSSGHSDIFIQKMSVTTSDIAGNLNKPGISVYPNPTTGILNIESLGLNDLKIQILNSGGQIVMDETSKARNPTFSIQHFSEGLYLVRVINDNKIIATQKIIRQ